MAEAPQKAENACLTCGPLQQAGLNERLLNAVVAISGCATLEEALEPLLDAALDVTKMDGGGVYWVEGGVAVLRHHRGLPEAFIREVTRMPLDPVPLGILLHQRQPLELTEISPVMRDLCRRYGIHHAFSFPLRAGDALFGFLNVASIHGGTPEQADTQALLILVNEIESLFFRLYTEKALRQSEERFSAFMDNSPAIAWMRDEQGRYVYLSKSYTRYTGRSFEEYRGRTVFDLWPREIAEGFWKVDQEVLRTGRPIDLIEEVPAPDGGRQYWRNFKFRFQDASGRRFVGGIGVDITERKRMLETLQQLKEHLEEQVQVRTEELNQTVQRLQSLTLELIQVEDRERKRLAEFLHDDLQQTLAAVKFHLGILAGRIRSDEMARQTLDQTTQLLKEAIQRTRSLSHELGPPVLSRSRLDAICEWLAGQMESKHGLIVHVDVRASAESNSEPVRNLLYRAAHEILFNMVKHAHVCEARLRLQRVRNELWLTLMDRGCGFDPASLATAAGLGLPTIRERVELLGGRMKIKSAPGKGSTFFLAVPDVPS